jgi:hypothetical protein
MFPPLPLARELKVGLAIRMDRTGCRLRRSPGLAVLPACSLPEALPVFVSVTPTEAGQPSDAPQCLRATFSALQSRGGDGFLPCAPDQVGVTVTVFPSTKSAVIVVGRCRPL